MCIIMSCSEKHPTREMLENAELTNPHGAGISWVKNDMVYWRKGITAKQIYKMIKSDNIKLPYTIHFRIASIGAITKALTHPFPIELSANTKLHGKAKAVLFHNGTWSDWKKEFKHIIKSKHIKKSLLPKGEMSDSRAMAFLTSVKGTKQFEKMTFNKVSIQDKKEIHHYGTWQTLDSIKISNNYGLIANQFQYYDSYDSCGYGFNETYKDTFYNKQPTDNMKEYNEYIYSDNWQFVEQADYQDLKIMLYKHKQGYCECYQCQHILEVLTELHKDMKSRWKNTKRLARSENINTRVEDSQLIGNPTNDYEAIYNENMINAKEYFKSKRRKN